MVMQTVRGAFYGALVALVPMVAGAQAALLGTLPVGVGERVRVRASGHPVIVGTVSMVDSTRLVVRATSGSAHGGEVWLPITDLRRVDRSVGREPRSGAFLRGAKIGALTGGGVAVVATAIALHYDLSGRCGDCILPSTPFVAAAGVLLTGATTLVGGAIGSGMRREQWSPVTLPTRVGVVPLIDPGARRAGLAVAIPF